MSIISIVYFYIMVFKIVLFNIYYTHYTDYTRFSRLLSETKTVFYLQIKNKFHIREKV